MGRYDHKDTTARGVDVYYIPLHYAGSQPWLSVAYRRTRGLVSETRISTLIPRLRDRWGWKAQKLENIVIGGEYCLTSF